MKFKCFKKLGAKFKDFYRKNDAEIYLVAGIVSVVGGVIAGCIGTTKLEGVLDEHENSMKEVKNEVKEEGLNRKTERKLVTRVYSKTVLSMAKIYIPSFVLTSAGITMLLKSHSVMKKRNAALIAAFETVFSAFDKYRARVIDRYGSDIDKELYYGTEKEKIKKKGEDGKVKTIEEVYFPDELPGFDRYFDKYNVNFQEEEKYGYYAMRANFMFLKGKEDYINNMLSLHNFILLNDVYEELRLPRSSAGCRMGALTLDGAVKVGKPELAVARVSFGIDWDNPDENVVTVRHQDGSVEKKILLHFNVAKEPIDKYVSKLSGTEAWVI